MVSKLYSMGLLGIDAFVVQVESDVSRGMPSFEIVGLPDASVRESRDRVRAALKNCGFQFPVSRITINLAPADIKKAGPVYDLPILISLLQSIGQIEPNINIIEKSIFVGELSLCGDINPINGVLSMVIKAKEEGFTNIFVPKANAPEGAVVSGISVIPVENVISLVKHITGVKNINSQPRTSIVHQTNRFVPDFSQVKGQYDAKRALEIAAAGGHNVLLIGPPGSGKSMLAKRMPSILPDMTFEEIIETTKIHSIAGTLPNDSPLIVERPFRSPHHTVSPAGLSGGGTVPKPGELSLSHNGILFLDELPEFSRSSLEVLRQPIEDGVVTISRVKTSLTYPCSVILIAAMNPCPCGYFGHPTRECICSRKAVSKYLARVSGPLLDRLDLHIEVPPVNFENISSADLAETSNDIKSRVSEARKIQSQRYKGFDISCNARIPSDLFHDICKLNDDAKSILKTAFENIGLSARAYNRILKISRTIADLDKKEEIKKEHMAEAIQYRSLDRKYWFRSLY